MIRRAGASDHARILRLYREVATVPDGIARTPDEVSVAYVSGFMQRAEADGIELVCEQARSLARSTPRGAASPAWPTC